MGQKAKKILLLLASVAVLCAVIIVANTQAQKRKLAVSMDFIMDTVIEQKLYGKNGQQAVDEISRRLREYEQMCSMYLEESQVSQINQNAGKEYIEVSDQCLELIERSKQYAEQSNGLFDITIAPLTTLWGITSDHPKVPSQQEIDWRCKDSVIWFAWNTGCPLLHRSRIGSARKELFIPSYCVLHEPLHPFPKIPDNSQPIKPI